MNNQEAQFETSLRAGWWISGILLFFVVLFSGCQSVESNRPANSESAGLTLPQASKTDPASRHKLLVQIETRPCPSQDSAGCFERGDVLLIKPGDWEFSDGEKEGFLIIQMDITEVQAEELVRSLDKEAQVELPQDEGEEETSPSSETLKLRKYAVDLGEIGLRPDEGKGREITDEIYAWDVIKEKE